MLTSHERGTGDFEHIKQRKCASMKTGRRLESINNVLQMVATVFIIIFTSMPSDAATPTAPSGQSIHLQTLAACDRSSPLGMISGDIKDWQLSSSSTRPSVESDSSCHERYARLYQPNGYSWCAKYKTSSEWLQIDLGVVAKVTGVLTQGRGDGEEWMTAFLISHSLDAFNWVYVGDNSGNKKIFDGNSDSYSVKAAYFGEPVVARFMRFHTYSWHGHPSFRVEVIGCQPCKTLITLPTTTKVSASSEQPTAGKSSCRAEDGLLMTGKAWCAKGNDAGQWLQFDNGPPSLVTGIVTMGRGDSNREQWVTRYRVAYSNDSALWRYYSDASHLEPKEFGGNVNADIERWHFVNSPFVARYIRIYPIDWSTHISLRAGIIGCRYNGHCQGEFTRVNAYAPCVENLSYKKPIWVNSYRPTHKKRRHTSLGAWRRATSGSSHVKAREITVRRDDVSGSKADSCVTLNTAYVDKPTLRVDLGQRSLVTGVIVTALTSLPKTREQLPGSVRNATKSSQSRGKKRKVIRLDVYVSNDIHSAESLRLSHYCGSYATNTKDGNTAVTSPIKTRLNIQCSGQGAQQHEGRYIYIQATGPTRREQPNSSKRPKKRNKLSIDICDVIAY